MIPQKITIEQLLKDNKIFAKAYSESHQLTTDQLLERFDVLDYKSFGFGAIQFWKMTRDSYWDCALRNSVDWKEEQLDVKSKDARIAIAKMYAWCVMKGYLPESN